MDQAIWLGGALCQHSCVSASGGAKKTLPNFFHANIHILTEAAHTCHGWFANLHKPSLSATNRGICISMLPVDNMAFTTRTGVCSRPDWSIASNTCLSTSSSSKNVTPWPWIFSAMKTHLAHTMHLLQAWKHQLDDIGHWQHWSIACQQRWILQLAD